MEINTTEPAHLHVGTREPDAVLRILAETPYFDAEIFEPVGQVFRDGDQWEAWGESLSPGGVEHIVISVPPYAALSIVAVLIMGATQGETEPGPLGQMFTIDGDHSLLVPMVGSDHGVVGDPIIAVVTDPKDWSENILTVTAPERI